MILFPLCCAESVIVFSASCYYQKEQEHFQQIKNVVFHVTYYVFLFVAKVEYNLLLQRNISDI